MIKKIDRELATLPSAPKKLYTDDITIVISVRHYYYSGFDYRNVDQLIPLPQTTVILVHKVGFVEVSVTDL